MARMLGRLPADPSKPALKAARILTGVTPDHPATVDYASEVPAWGMLANDKYGVCGPAGVAHQRMQIARYLSGGSYTPSLDDVFGLYRLCNPDFDPNTGAGDNGVVLQDMLGYVANQGFAGTKAIAYAKVDHTNADEMKAAIAVFGSLLFGVDLDVAQQTQTDNGGPWDYVRSAQWGGHCVLAVAYRGTTSRQGDIAVVTWGELLGTTPAFNQRQLSECWAVLWPEHLASKEFQAGVDLATLAADYLALTGRTLPLPSPSPAPPPFPVPPAPTPTPAPVPAPQVDDADRYLARAVTDWAHARHSGPGSRVAQAFRAWLKAKGL